MFPAAAPVRSRLRSWLGFPGLLLLALWGLILVRSGPHLAAALGVETGSGAVPSYRYAALDGGGVSAAQLRGQVVLVNFWATWCPPCRVEMPLLESMYRRHRDRGFVVLGLSVDTDPAAVGAFIDERGVSYPVAVVAPDADAVFGGITAYPTSLLLDREGRIRHRVTGALAPASLEPAVRRLLDEPAPARR